jgi:ATP-binding cassette subfamily C protein
VWRAAALLDKRGRRDYALAIPCALVVMLLELAGFVALAAVVQVLASPGLLAKADPTGLVGVIQNVVHANSAMAFVATVGTVAVGLLLSRGVAACLLSWWQAGLMARAETALSSRLFRAYMSADYGFHLENHSADLIRTVTQSVRSLITRVLLPGFMIITDLTLIVGLAGALLVMQPLAAFASMSALCLAMAVYLLGVRRAARRIGVDDERLGARDQRLVQEGLGSVKVLTILGRRERVAERFEVMRDEHSQALRGLFFMTNLSRYYLEAAVLIVVVSVAAAAILEGREGSLASMGVLLAGSMRLLPSAQRLMTALNTVRVGMGSVDSVERDLAVARAVGGGATSVTAPITALSFSDGIELRNLTYHYPASSIAALRRIDLKVAFGESVGIVGASGAGKTTLVDVLIGLLTPTRGGVYVDGVEVTRAHLPQWRAHIGYVPQDTVIVDDTVRRNVALGLDDDEIDDDAVRRALTQAQLWEAIQALPDGLDSTLGERGVRMSGGQRQRIGIARALYHQPKILVLDEATAALDTVTEDQIAATIEQLYGQVTIFSIAHRLSTVARCDIRVLLNAGQIEEIGTFEGIVVGTHRAPPPAQTVRQ